MRDYPQGTPCLHFSFSRQFITKKQVMPPKFTHFLVLLTTITLFSCSYGQHGILLDSFSSCNTYLVLKCVNETDSSLESYGNHCCIFAKLQYCLISNKETLIKCPNLSDQIFERYLDCKSQTFYPSLECFYFYYKPHLIMALFVIGVIAYGLWYSLHY